MDARLSACSDLSALKTLDRERLHLFLAGPGVGEGIALALPGSGWILVDSCRTRSGLPLLEVVRRFRAKDEPLALILTHPHDDHADGFAELVETLEPQWIGVAGAPDPKESLVRSLVALLRELGDEVESDRLVGAKTEAAVRAIAEWERRNPKRLQALHDGTVLPLGNPCCTVRTRAPERAALASALRPKQARKSLRSRANELSLVLEIEFGATRVVLGGDLPDRRASGSRVPTGWSHVMTVHPHLADHHLLKVPHHGSAQAQHPALVAARAGVRRAWGLTPYNRSNLPRLAALDGLAALLASEPLVHLTALPSSKRLAAPIPASGAIPLAGLTSSVPPAAAKEAFLAGAVDVTASDLADPWAPLWAFALNREGALLDRWRGTSAVAITP